MSAVQSGPRLEAILRRERAILLATIAAVTALCWIYLVLAARQMDSMEMSGMSLAAMRPSTPLDLALLAIMWVVMMVGMMLPTATPMILLYARVARKAAGDGGALVPTHAFALGYVAVWTLFSVGATAAQWGLERLALLSPAMVSTSPALGAAILVAAGLYQLTPWKSACLDHCRDPARFLSAHWRPGTSGAVRMGLDHGWFCLGCCWILMALLFVGGVMNLLWIAAITLFVLLEKVAPLGEAGGRAAGVALLGAGAALFWGWVTL